MKIKIGTKDISGAIFSYERSASFSDKRIIGNASSEQLTISIDNDVAQLTKAECEGSIVDVLPLEGNAHRQFKVYEYPETWDGIITVKCYDTVYYLSMAYATNLTYPVTIADQLDEMQTIASITIDRTAIPSWVLSKTVGWYDNTITIRSYLAMIAEIFGANVSATSVFGQVAFSVISKTPSATFADVLDYTKGTDYIVSRVCYDDGTSKFEKGDTTGNTVYISNYNLYCDAQSVVDNVYAALNGLSLNGATGVETDAFADASLAKIVTITDVLTMIIMGFTETYSGGDAPDYELSGELSTTNEEVTINKVSNDTRIRKVQTTIDQINANLSIVAQDVDANTKEITNLTVGLNQFEASVENTYANKKDAVASEYTEYYLSSSSTELSSGTSESGEIIGGSWVTTPPQYVNGYYYWTRSCVTKANGSVSYSTPIMNNNFKTVIEDYQDKINNANESIANVLTTESSDFKQTKDYITTEVNDRKTAINDVNSIIASNKSSIEQTVSSLKSVIEDTQRAVLGTLNYFRDIGDKVLTATISDTSSKLTFNDDGILLGIVNPGVFDFYMTDNFIDGYDDTKTYSTKITLALVTTDATLSKTVNVVCGNQSKTISITKNASETVIENILFINDKQFKLTFSDSNIYVVITKLCLVSGETYREESDGIQTLSTEIDQTNSTVSFISSQLDEVKSSVEGVSDLEYLKKIIIFNDSAIKDPSITICASKDKDGNPSGFATVITNKQMSFYQNYGDTNPIAYMTGYELHISRSVITDEMSIGSDEKGMYRFKPLSNGSLALVYMKGVNN